MPARFLNIHQRLEIDCRMFVVCSVEVFIPLFVDDSDLLLLFLSLLVHGVQVASRLVRQYETLCTDAKLQEAIEEARLAIASTPSIFGCIPFSSLLELLLRTLSCFGASTKGCQEAQPVGCIGIASDPLLGCSFG